MSYDRGDFDSVRVRIYPSDESVYGRRWTLLIATVSATAVAAAVFCVVASMLVWTGHVGRRTPSATNLINHYDESDGHYFSWRADVWARTLNVWVM